MSTKHNKKRNTGLLYEFLVRCVSESIVNKDDNRKNIALQIIKNHFVKDSELYREFRLFNSLIATKVNSESVAETIIETAKKASRQYDEEKLDREKSLLIRSINHSLNDMNFYNKRFNEYKMYATVQTLLNEWRSDRYSDIVTIAQYEDNLKKWLLADKTKEALQEKYSQEETDPLVEKLMLNKFNEKYGDTLTEAQKSIVKNYVFLDDRRDELQQYLKDLKENTIKEINSFLNNPEEKNSYVNAKLKTAKELIESINLDSIDDDVIIQFMDIAKLKSELIEK